jgi:hypothetical protein
VRGLPGWDRSGWTGQISAGGHGQAGGWTDSEYEAYAKRREQSRSTADAEGQWKAEEGVAPVLRPSKAEPNYDPGPGVIGLDR